MLCWVVVPGLLAGQSTSPISMFLVLCHYMGPFTNNISQEGRGYWSKALTSPSGLQTCVLLSWVTWVTQVYQSFSLWPRKKFTYGKQTFKSENRCKCELEIFFLQNLFGIKCNILFFCHTNYVSQTKFKHWKFLVLLFKKEIFTNFK